jgi:ribosomal protein S27AE
MAIYGSDKWKVQQQVSKAVKEGILKRPEYCPKCGIKGKIQAHHEDYSKPFEVIWLCMKCHRGIHRKSKEPVIPDQIKLVDETKPLDREIFLKRFGNLRYEVKYTPCSNYEGPQFKRTYSVYNKEGFVVYRETYYILAGG